jgi:hypothetical protein
LLQLAISAGSDGPLGNMAAALEDLKSAKGQWTLTASLLPCFRKLLKRICAHMSSNGFCYPSSAGKRVEALASMQDGLAHKKAFHSQIAS